MKNALSTSAKSSTTYDPSIIDRTEASPAASVNMGMSATVKPKIPTTADNHLRSWGRKRSTPNTASTVAATMKSGARAW
jgi:hypothetical protein